MTIGVFDSGIGGRHVAQTIEEALPEDEVLFRRDDPRHFPYATKTPDQIFEFVVPVLQSLIDDGCRIVVIACNTVSTTLIGRLRECFNVPLVAIEPMVKPAAEYTKTGKIAVCATPTTLASPRYAELKQRYAANVTVIEPDCADWSRLIEYDEMNRMRLREEIEPALRAGVDVIVLGCTHYHWIQNELQSLAGKDVVVMQPEQAVIEELKRVIARLA